MNSYLGYSCHADVPADCAPQVRGVLAVFRDADRFLLIRRAAGVRLGGLWCFPGGTIEPGESEPIALAREMREELGLIVRPDRRIMVMTKESGRLMLHWWSVTVERGDLRPDPAEVADTRWMTPAEIRAWPQTNSAPHQDDPPQLITGSHAILEWLGL